MGLSGIELYQMVCDELDAAESCLHQMPGLGRDRADAERCYRKALAEAELDCRDRKIPVSIIGDIVRGREDIADLRYARDCAEVLFEANRSEHYMHRQRAELYAKLALGEWSGARYEA